MKMLIKQRARSGFIPLLSHFPPKNILLNSPKISPDLIHRAASSYDTYTYNVLPSALISGRRRGQRRNEFIHCYLIV